MLLQNILEALSSIRGNRLRAVLTILIIAFGIMAMVGVLTSIDGLKYWMRSSFSTMGANTFTVRNLESNVRVGGGKRNRVTFPRITYEQATRLKQWLHDDGMAAASLRATGAGNATAIFEQQKSNPNVQVIGTDENFMVVESYRIAEGRSLTPDDVEQRRNVCLIGHELQVKLFPGSTALDHEITVHGRRYLVVGVMGERGASFGSPGDKVCMIPISTLDKYYGDDDMSFDVNVYVPQAEQLIPVAEQTIGLFRLTRGLRSEQPSNFAVILADSFVEDLMENLRILTLSAIFITIITLFGASVGLMNIMLVSVTERTMEIGLRKALGATRGHILLQFLTEAVTICQIGGMLGVGFGLGLGYGVSRLLDAKFVMPWTWIFVGLGVCFFVGIVSGIYPARRAASLDPIDALRYE